jgi:hypothetical protein
MKKSTKLLTVVIAVFIVVVGSFWYCHPTHYRYNDRFIIGSTIEQIEEKYGEMYRWYNPDEELEPIGLYHVKKVNYDLHRFYEIFFENGIAVKVELVDRPWSDQLQLS